MRYKLFITSILFFCVYSLAVVKCNTPDNIVVLAPKRSCWASSVMSTIGMDIDESSESSGASTSFFLELNDVTVPNFNQQKTLRFTVNSNSPYYNEFQAIAQTAYATKSIIMVVFPNPSLGNNKCTTIEDRLICPLEGISISR